MTAMHTRYGKTERERSTGEAGRRQHNKRARADWRNSRDSKGDHSLPFPDWTCNGKRNRYHVTGKNREVVTAPFPTEKTRRHHRRRNQ